MNRRIIQKILKKKHEEFCSSIKDEIVQKLVKKNSFITGGSIVSLLLNEKVSDFDYYFTDFDTVKAVADYYVKEFIQLNPEHKIQPQVVVEDSRVRVKVKSVGIASEKSDNDYKFFENYPHEEAMDYVDKMTECLEDVTIKEDPGEDKPAYRPIFLSNNAITLSNKIQLVIRFYGSPEEVHKNYDFIHCTNYWLANDGKLVLSPAALESILTKELFYQGSLYPICSVIRTRKFIKKGWHINAGQFLKMCFQISKLDLTDLNTLQDQLTGVDAAYFIEIIEYCKRRKEQEPDFEVTMPYLCTIVDRIFGSVGD